MVNSISAPIVAAVIAVSLLATAGVEAYALRAKERADNPPQLIDRAYCTKCHNTPEMLARMKEKEGNCHFLFKAGDPTVANYKETLRKAGITRAKLARHSPKDNGSANGNREMVGWPPRQRFLS